MEGVRVRPQGGPHAPGPQGEPVRTSEATRTSHPVRPWTGPDLRTKSPGPFFICYRKKSLLSS
jgi:hypothetical protein